MDAWATRPAPDKETARFSVDRIGESELKTPWFSFPSLLDSVPRCLLSAPLDTDTSVCRVAQC